MASDINTKVLLFGLGAIGGFYAFILGRNPNVQLSVVARSNYQSVKKEGLKIKSENHGDHTANIHNVYQSPSEADVTFDYIICVNKAINQDAIAASLKSVVNDSTTFVIVQNGVGNEEPFRKAYPLNTIISCVTWVGAVQPSPGLIKHTKSEDMQIGLFPNPSIDEGLEKSRLDTFAGFLRTGGTVFQVVDNIQVERWSKCTWNAAWNPITTLTMVDTQTWLKSTPEAMAMTRQLMREMIDIAKKCDVPIGYELIDTLINRILAMPGIGSSMQVDAKAGRPLEVDVILGYPMKKAKEFDMDVPTLSAVYALTMAVHGRLLNGSS